MTFLKIVLAGAAVISLSAGSASAATFMFTVTDTSGVVLSGDFTTSGPTLQSYGESVTSLTATLGPGAVGFSPTGSVTLIANPNVNGAQATSASGSFFYDNLYDGTIGANQQGTGFDNNGLLFSVGGIEFNLFSNGAGQPYTLYEQFTGGGPGTNESVNFSTTAVPEPASWAMMVLGAGLMGGALRSMRRRRFVAA